MGPLYRDRFHVGLLSCLAVILFLFPSAWTYADDCKRVQNILVLFDASGYMKERGRYQILLKQMRFFEEAMPLTADGFFDVGLRHYGLKVGLGCNNTQSILAIQPWDPSVIADIERAILKANLGLTPQNDGKIIRIQIPSLTQERREELTKVVRKAAEEGRVSVRNARHEGIEQVKKFEKSKVISEDASHVAQKEVQKITDKFVSQIDEALKHKEDEIHTI